MSVAPVVWQSRTKADNSSKCLCFTNSAGMKLSSCPLQGKEKRSAGLFQVKQIPRLEVLHDFGCAIEKGPVNNIFIFN